MPEPTLNSNIGLYRSGVTSPERLRHTSVAREHLLDNAIESLRGSVGRKSKNHLLFIGPRGIGKTHLLSCIEDAVQSDETLSASVVIVRFPEESNRTLSFADFLIGMCGILKEVLEDEPLWTELFAEVETEEDDAKVADTLVPAIREENRRRGRTSARYARKPRRGPYPANSRPERCCRPAQISHGRQRLPADGHRTAAFRRHHRRGTAVL